MCGIAGFLSSQSTADGFLREPVARMCERMVHRGPDMHGYAVDGPVCLGHRRLSIIDLSPEGAQPMANEDGSVQIVVNGEIYNFGELRAELEGKGHRFRSHSDSEVALHLYEELGTKFLGRLRGMFALALWDRKQRRLLLARDPVGKKPLYYYQGPQGLLFASEVQALVGSDRVPREPDLDAIDAYLGLQYVPSPLCAFRGVRKLAPGSFALCTPGQEPTVQRYHRLDFHPDPDLPRDRGALLAELRRQLQEAVRLRMVADVPLGAFLSGGLDSSLVVALMAGLSSRPVKTFSVGFPEQDLSELPYARLVAQRWGTDHHEIMVNPDMVAIVPKLVWHYGEPFADASSVPTWYLAEVTKRHVTVALSGDGGDETFGGYDRYRIARLLHKLLRLPRPLRAALSAGLRSLPFPSLQPLRNTGLRLRQTEAERYEGWIGHFEHRERLAIYHPDLQARFARDVVSARFDQTIAGGTAADAVGRLMELDSETYLPDDILVKVDIASMAHALEVRAPILDREFMRFAASLPTDLKLRGFSSKVLLREMAKDLLPAKILRRRKRGFGLPIHRWMRRELVAMSRDTLLDGTARGRGLFAPAAVEALLAAHARGEPHGHQIWNLMMLELWFRTFIDRRPDKPGD
jgi:asparagine synthase (glutamine-hydrolysing)